MTTTLDEIINGLAEDSSYSHQNLLQKRIFDYLSTGIKNFTSQPTPLKTSFPKPETFLTFDIDRISHDAAKCWSVLGSDTRSAISVVLRGVGGIDEATSFVNAFNILKGLAALPKSLKKLQALSEEILKNQEEMKHQLSKITDRLERIESKLDEQTLMTARKGLQHLVSAANTDVDKVREQQLQLASGDFSTLIQLNPNSQTKGITGTAENSSLIAIGYWGNHLYFKMQGDLRNSLINVYECTLQFPMKGLVIFDPAYFSKNYQAQLDELAIKLKKAISTLKAVEQENAALKGRFSSDYLVKSALGALAGIGIFGASSLVGAPHYGAMLALGAYRAAVAGVAKPNLQDGGPQQEEIYRLTNAMEETTAELLDECNTQIGLLQKTTLADLLKISNSTS